MRLSDKETKKMTALGEQEVVKNKELGREEFLKTRRQINIKETILPTPLEIFRDVCRITVVFE